MMGAVTTGTHSPDRAIAAHVAGMDKEGYVMRSLIGAVTISVVALAPVTESAADGWVLWQQESQITPYKKPPPMTTVGVHPDQATCVAAAHELAVARRQRVLDRPVPPGFPADYDRTYLMTVASDITTHKNKQGHSVILENWDSANYKKDPAADVLKARSFIYSASCWPVGVTPQ